MTNGKTAALSELQAIAAEAFASSIPAAFGLHGALVIGPLHSIAAHAEDWSRTLATFKIDLKRGSTRIQAHDPRLVAYDLEQILR
jgi:hypothetical protein